MSLPTLTRAYLVLAHLAVLLHSNVFADWELDADYIKPPNGVNERVYALGLDNAERLVVGGLFTAASGASSRGLARFFQDGSRDSSFHIGSGVANGTYNYITDLIILPDDSVVIVGDFGSFNGIIRGNIARIKADGSLDLSFANGLGADAIIRHIEHSGDGGYIIGGNFSTYDGIPRSRLAKLKHDGSLDDSVTFDRSFEIDEWVDQIEVFSNGTILAAGDFSPYNVSKFLSDGTTDESFVYDYFNYDYVEATYLTSDGKILIGGVGGLHRHNADGSFDNGFQPNLNYSPEVYGLAELPDGRYVATGRFGISGTSDIYNMAIFDTSGSVDSTAIMAPFEPSSWVGPTIVNGEHLIFAGAFTWLVSDYISPASSHNRIGRFNINPSTNLANTVYFDRSAMTLLEGDTTQRSFNLTTDQPPESPISITLEIVSEEPAGAARDFTHIQTNLQIPADGSNHTQIDINSAGNHPGYQGTRKIRYRIASVSEGYSIGEPSEIELVLADDELHPNLRFSTSHIELVEDSHHEFEPVEFRLLYDSPIYEPIQFQLTVTADDTQIANTIQLSQEWFDLGNEDNSITIQITSDDDNELSEPELLVIGIETEMGHEDLLANPSNMQVRRHDKDSIKGWLILRYPDIWDDSNILLLDSDYDGHPTLLEWLNDSNPDDPSSQKFPTALTEHFDEEKNPYFSIRFYYSYKKAGYATLIEHKSKLSDPSWSTIWRSDVDPDFTSELVLNQPSEDGNDWAEIRLPAPIENSGYVRIRYEEL